MLWHRFTNALLATSTSMILLPASALGEPLPRFPPSAPWYQPIDTAPLHPDSATMIDTVMDHGGFGGGRLQIDFSLHVVRATEEASALRIVPHSEGYYLPDCETLATAVVPVPANAAIEGTTTLDCENTTNDCHLLVVQARTLFEAYRVTRTRVDDEPVLEAQCLATWDLDTVYPPENRGDHCTSADAAGLPMSPLLFNADEISAALALDATGGGTLGHAIRFTLPNDRIATDPSLGGAGGRLYVRPASHAGGPAGPADAVPYGARLRLRADFDVISGYSPPARVILNTLKRYGMILADGGTIALTAESDRYTDTQWSDLGIDSRIFDQTPGASMVLFSDFEVVDTGPRIAETYDCVRTDRGVFENGFELGRSDEIFL